MILFSRCRVFEWDKGNVNKNISKHKVFPEECEEVFFNGPRVDKVPRECGEERFYALGVTDKSRKLTVIFTIRNEKIRVISARAMSKKERGEYGKENKKGS